MISGLHFQALLEDREREVQKNVEVNQIYRHYWESASNLSEATKQDKDVLIPWLRLVSKRIKGVLQISNKNEVKV